MHSVFGAVTEDTSCLQMVMEFAAYGDLRGVMSIHITLYMFYTDTFVFIKGMLEAKFIHVDWTQYS